VCGVGPAVGRGAGRTTVGVCHGAGGARSACVGSGGEPPWLGPRGVRRQVTRAQVQAQVVSRAWIRRGVVGSGSTGYPRVRRAQHHGGWAAGHRRSPGTCVVGRLPCLACQCVAPCVYRHGGHEPPVCKVCQLFRAGPWAAGAALRCCECRWAAFMEKEYAAWRRARPALIREALGGLRGFPVCIQHAASSGVTLFPPEQFADLQNCKIAESSGGRMLASMGHSR